MNRQAFEVVQPNNRATMRTIGDAMEATSSEVSTPMPPVIALRDMKEHKTVTIRTNQLQVGDMVLAWGAHFRKVLSISTHVAISEYQLYGESETHRHSWKVEQLILDRTTGVAP